MGVQIFVQEFSASEKHHRVALACLVSKGVASFTVACSLPAHLNCHTNHTGKSWKDEVANDSLKSCNSVGMRHFFTKPVYMNKDESLVRTVVF